MVLPAAPLARRRPGDGQSASARRGLRDGRAVALGRDGRADRHDSPVRPAGDPRRRHARPESRSTGTVRGTLRVANVLGRILDAPVPDGSRAARADDAPSTRASVWTTGSGVRGRGWSSIASRRSCTPGGVFVEGSITAQARVDDGGTGHLNVDGSGVPRRARALARACVPRPSRRACEPRSRIWRRSSTTDSTCPAAWKARTSSLASTETTLAAPRFSVSATTARIRPGAEPLAGAITFSADALSVRDDGVTGGADLMARLVVSRRRSPVERIDLSDSEVRLRNAHASIKGAAVLIPSLRVRARNFALAGSRPSGRIAVEVPDIELPLSLVPNALLLLPKGLSIEGGQADGRRSRPTSISTVVTPPVRREGRGARGCRLGSGRRPSTASCASI